MDEGEGPLLICQYPFEAVLRVLGQSRGLYGLEQVGVHLLYGVVPDPVPGLVGVGAQGEILPNPESILVGIHLCNRNIHETYLYKSSSAPAMFLKYSRYGELPTTV